MNEEKLRALQLKGDKQAKQFELQDQEQKKLYSNFYPDVYNIPDTLEKKLLNQHLNDFQKQKNQNNSNNHNIMLSTIDQRAHIQNKQHFQDQMQFSNMKNQNQVDSYSGFGGNTNNENNRSQQQSALRSSDPNSLKNENSASVEFFQENAQEDKETIISDKSSCLNIIAGQIVENQKDMESSMQSSISNTHPELVNDFISKDYDMFTLLNEIIKSYSTELTELENSQNQNSDLRNQFYQNLFLQKYKGIINRQQKDLDFTEENTQKLENQQFECLYSKILNLKLGQQNDVKSQSEAQLQNLLQPQIKEIQQESNQQVKQLENIDKQFSYYYSQSTNKINFYHQISENLEISQIALFNNDIRNNSFKPIISELSSKIDNQIFLQPENLYQNGETRIFTFFELIKAKFDVDNETTINYKEFHLLELNLVNIIIQAIEKNYQFINDEIKFEDILIDRKQQRFWVVYYPTKIQKEQIDKNQLILSSIKHLYETTFTNILPYVSQITALNIDKRKTIISNIQKYEKNQLKKSFVQNLKEFYKKIGKKIDKMTENFFQINELFLSGLESKENIELRYFYDSSILQSQIQLINIYEYLDKIDLETLCSILEFQTQGEEEIGISMAYNISKLIMIQNDCQILNYFNIKIINNIIFLIVQSEYTQQQQVCLDLIKNYFQTINSLLEFFKTEELIQNSENLNNEFVDFFLWMQGLKPTFSKYLQEDNFLQTLEEYDKKIQDFINMLLDTQPSPILDINQNKNNNDNNQNSGINSTVTSNEEPNQNNINNNNNNNNNMNNYYNNSQNNNTESKSLNKNQKDDYTNYSIKISHPNPNQLQNASDKNEKNNSNFYQPSSAYNKKQKNLSNNDLNQSNNDFNQSNNDYNQPNNDYNQSNYDNSQISNDSNQSNNDYNQPNNDYNQPNSDYNQTNNDNNQPNNDYNQTNNDNNQPNNDYNQSNYDYNQSGNDFNQSNNDNKYNNDTNQPNNQSNNELNQSNNSNNKNSENSPELKQSLIIYQEDQQMDSGNKIGINNQDSYRKEENEYKQKEKRNQYKNTSSYEQNPSQNQQNNKSKNIFEINDSQDSEYDSMQDNRENPTRKQNQRSINQEQKHELDNYMSNEKNKNYTQTMSFSEEQDKPYNNKTYGQTSNQNDRVEEQVFDLNSSKEKQNYKQINKQYDNSKIEKDMDDFSEKQKLMRESKRLEIINDLKTMEYLFNKGQIQPNSVEYANMLILQSNLEYQQEESQISQEMVKQGIEILSKNKQGNEVNLAQGYDILGTIVFNNQENKQAQTLFKKSLEIQLEKFEAESPSIADTYFSLGCLYKQEQQNELAEKNLVLCAEIRQQNLSIQRSQYINALENLCSVYQYMNQNRELEMVFEQIIEYYQPLYNENHDKNYFSKIVYYKSLLSIHYVQLSEKFKLEELTVSLIQLYQNYHDKNREDLINFAEIKGRLAQILLMTDYSQNSEQIKGLYLGAIEIIRTNAKILEEKEKIIPMILIMAEIFQKQSKDQQSQDIQKLGLVTFQNEKDKNNSDAYGDFLLYCGKESFFRKDYDSTKSFVQQSISIQSQHYEQQKQNIIDCHEILVNVNYKLQNYPECFQFIEQLIKIQVSLGEKSVKLLDLRFFELDVLVQLKNFELAKQNAIITIEEIKQDQILENSKKQLYQCKAQQFFVRIVYNLNQQKETEQQLKVFEDHINKYQGSDEQKTKMFNFFVQYQAKLQEMK